MKPRRSAFEQDGDVLDDLVVEADIEVIVHLLHEFPDAQRTEIQIVVSHRSNPLQSRADIADSDRAREDAGN